MGRGGSRVSMGGQELESLWVGVDGARVREPLWVGKS